MEIFQFIFLYFIGSLFVIVVLFLIAIYYKHQSDVLKDQRDFWYKSSTCYQKWLLENYRDLKDGLEGEEK